MSDGGFVVSGKSQMEMFRRLQVASALALEINTGMRMSRGSVMNVARDMCGTQKRTKKGVLKDYVAWMKREVPTYEPNSSVRQAAGL